MAETEANQTTLRMIQDNEKKLKYLDFVQLAAIYVVVCFSTIYDYAKENSGPLKAGVQTVEDTVKTVIGPVYEKFHDVPIELLMFVDRKVDDTIIEADRHVPSFVKQVSSQALSAARSITSEVQRDGAVEAASKSVKYVYAKYEPMVKEYYVKYEPVVEYYAVTTWCSLNRIPFFSQVAEIIVPTATYSSEKYNQAVACLAEEGYTVSYYMPLIPVEKIKKVFNRVEN